MISKEEKRSPENIRNMISEQDYDFFRKQGFNIINKMDGITNDKSILLNEKVNILIDYFNGLYPSFLEVFIEQSNNCIFRPINETDEKKVLLEMQESDFYRHLLDKNFKVFPDTYESKAPVKWIIKYDTIKYPQVFSLDYFRLIKEYIEFILDSKDFKDYRLKVNSFFANEMWLFTCSYEELDDGDISVAIREKYRNLWKEYISRHDLFMKNIAETLK